MRILKVKKIENLLEKSMGLLYKKTPEHIFFTTRFGIHTFGMKFPIDILILDDKNKIVYIKEFMKPNRIFFWNPKYNKVIELPSGNIDREKIRIYERIHLEYTK